MNIFIKKTTIIIYKSVKDPQFQTILNAHYRILQKLMQTEIKYKFIIQIQMKTYFQYYVRKKK